MPTCKELAIRAVPGASDADGHVVPALHVGYQRLKLAGRRSTRVPVIAEGIPCGSIKRCILGTALWLQ